MHKRFRWEMPSGIMAEQLHPYNAEPPSVNPLTWSHAANVNSALSYSEARDRFVRKGPMKEEKHA